MSTKSYKEILSDAPDPTTPEFIEYLRLNNKVVFENDQWIVIENCKYHTTKDPWLTAFWKGNNGKITDFTTGWWCDLDILWYEFGEYEWFKKASKKQTVPERFHIHLIKK